MELFVFDANILINLDRYNPQIFPSLWQNIYSMIESKQLFSITEVEREISKKDDRINKFWHQIHDNYGFFKDMSESSHSKDYWNFMSELDQFVEFQKYGENKEVWADPYLITLGKIDEVTVVSGESIKSHPSRKIPYVCNQLNIKCIDLDKFMIQNGWKW